jgi:hypothetical protein
MTVANHIRKPNEQTQPPFSLAGHGEIANTGLPATASAVPRAISSTYPDVIEALFRSICRLIFLLAILSFSKLENSIR